MQTSIKGALHSQLLLQNRVTVTVTNSDRVYSYTKEEGEEEKEQWKFCVLLFANATVYYGDKDDYFFQAV